MMDIGVVILRFSLGIVFLLTAWKIFQDPKGWSMYIKSWQKPFLFMKPVDFMKTNALLDLFIGLLLLTPFFTWIVALIAVLHMCAVVITVGINGPEYRNLGILGGSIALFFLTLPPHFLPLW